MAAAVVLLAAVAVALAAVADPGGVIVNVDDPTAVVWAGVGAVGAVGFILGLLESAGLHRKWHGLTALLLSIGGAFAFGGAGGVVATDWRTLAGQGLLVAMASVGTYVQVQRLTHHRPPD